MNNIYQCLYLILIPDVSYFSYENSEFSESRSRPHIIIIINMSEFTFYFGVV